MRGDEPYAPVPEQTLPRLIKLRFASKKKAGSCAERKERCKKCGFSRSLTPRLYLILTKIERAPNTQNIEAKMEGSSLS
jgi:hypothetical protein